MEMEVGRGRFWGLMKEFDDPRYDSMDTGEKPSTPLVASLLGLLPDRVIRREVKVLAKSEGPGKGKTSGPDFRSLNVRIPSLVSTISTRMSRGKARHGELWILCPEFSSFARVIN